MVETISLFDRARAIGGVFFGRSDDAPSSSNEPSEFGVDNTLTNEMRSTIAARITDGRNNAHALGEDFSIEHYRQACETFAGTDAGKAMVAEGKWSPASYADLSGQDLHGIRLTNPKAIKPDHELSAAVQSDYSKFQSIEADYDSFNRDGDAQINVSPISQFYDRVTFDKSTDLRNAIVDPATSFNKEIASAGNLEGLTINNMVNGDSFEFAGNYENIIMTNINGGEIVFGYNSRVDGLTIDGISAAISMGDNARVNNITVNDNFRIVSLSMGEGAVLSNSNLTNATISMASEFEQGATLQNVQLGNNVSGLDFSGVTFNNVTFNSSKLNDTSFAGATLNNVTFEGINLAELDLSDAKSFNGTINSKQVTSLKELTMLQQVASIGGVLQAAAKTIGNSSAAPAQMAETSIDSPAPASKTIFAFADTNLIEALAGGYNPGKDLIERIQPEQSMGMPRANA